MIYRLKYYKMNSKKAFLESTLFSNSDTNIQKSNTTNIQRKASVSDNIDINKYKSILRNKKLMKNIHS